MRAPVLVVAATLAGASFVGAVTTTGCGPQYAVASNAGPGGAAASFITSATTSMVIEIAPVGSETPDPGSLSLMLLRAREHCNKPDGIQIVVDPTIPEEPSPDGPRQWTLDALSAFATSNRQVAASPGQIVLFVAYVDGQLAGNPAVIGESFGPTTIAVFKDSLIAAFGSQASLLEGRVLVHELGHELGLVNQGIPMVTPHEDMAHPAHCTNPNCVMYWTLHGAVSPDEPLPPDDYDANCLADLEAAGSPVTELASGSSTVQ